MPKEMRQTGIKEPEKVAADSNTNNSRYESKMQPVETDIPALVAITFI